MGLLFRLPLLLFEYLLRRVFGGGQDSSYSPVVTPDAAAAAARPAPPPPGPAPAFVGDTGAPAEPAPPTAEEAIARREEREAAAAAAPEPASASVTPLRPLPDSPNGHVDSEPTLVESFGPSDDVGDVGGTITVDEPWDGYAGQSASAIVSRLRGADPATKAVVALYERGHKNRATVLKATG